MRSHILGFIVASLIFVMGIYIDEAWNIYSQPLIKINEKSLSTSSENFEKQGLDIISITFACGGQLSQQTYELSNGEMLYKKDYHYESHSQANKEFDKTLKEAVEIIKIEKDTVMDGHSIGHRAIATFSQDNQLIQYSVLWTENWIGSSTFHIISGPSLIKVLSLENSYRLSIERSLKLRNKIYQNLR